MGEIACVAIHPDYRKGNRGGRLLSELEKEAKEQQLESIFVLTTVSGHWFQEQGFIEQAMDKLPEGKKEMYNFRRNSKVFIKSI
jgi:amino-acid N-acetyltransferase